MEDPSLIMSSDNRSALHILALFRATCSQPQPPFMEHLCADGLAFFASLACWNFMRGRIILFIDEETKAQ